MQTLYRLLIRGLLVRVQQGAFKKAQFFPGKAGFFVSCRSIRNVVSRKMSRRLACVTRHTVRNRLVGFWNPDASRSRRKRRERRAGRGREGAVDSLLRQVGISTI